MSLKRTCRLLMLLPLLWLSGCGASLEDYRGQQPGWDLARFFDGKLVARLMAGDGWPLRQALMRLIGAIRPGPLPRVWQI